MRANELLQSPQWSIRGLGWVGEIGPAWKSGFLQSPHLVSIAMRHQDAVLICVSLALSRRGLAPGVMDGRPHLFRNLPLPPLAFRPVVVPTGDRTRDLLIASLTPYILLRHFAMPYATLDSCTGASHSIQTGNRRLQDQVCSTTGVHVFFSSTHHAVRGLRPARRPY